MEDDEAEERVCASQQPARVRDQYFSAGRHWGPAQQQRRRFFFLHRRYPSRNLIILLLLLYRPVIPLFSTYVWQWMETGKRRGRNEDGHGSYFGRRLKRAVQPNPLALYTHTHDFPAAQLDLFRTQKDVVSLFQLYVEPSFVLAIRFNSVVMATRGACVEF